MLCVVDERGLALGVKRWAARRLLERLRLCSAGLHLYNKTASLRASCVHKIFFSTFPGPRSLGGFLARELLHEALFPVSSQPPNAEVG